MKLFRVIPILLILSLYSFSTYAEDCASIKMDSSVNILKKINANKYRLSVGPFKNFSALKSIYISLSNLGFEDLNVYKE